MICKICGNKSEKKFSAKILNKYKVSFFYCERCGFLFTEDPYWLEEAYKSPINVSDTGYLQRNINLSKKITSLLYLFFNRSGKFLDWAGGYGVFVRLMRDIGFDFYWDDKYAPNLFAKGFEYKKIKNEKIEAITTFESFEYLANPIEELENMLQISKNIIFTTELLPYPIPDPTKWWYYGLNHGQHISFYSEKTFKFIASKYMLNYFNLNGLHVLSAKKLPKYLKYFLKLTRFGLHKFYEKKLKSKTWEDHLEMLNPQ